MSGRWVDPGRLFDLPLQISLQGSYLSLLLAYQVYQTRATQRNGRDHRSFWSPAANAEMSTEYRWILVDLIELRQQDTSKCSFLGALAVWVMISLSAGCISSMHTIFDKGVHRCTEAANHRDGSCSLEFHIPGLPETFSERTRVVEGDNGFLSKNRASRRFQTLIFLYFDETVRRFSS